MAVISLCFVTVMVGLIAFLIWAHRTGKIRRTRGGIEIDVEKVEFGYRKKR